MPRKKKQKEPEYFSDVFEILDGKMYQASLIGDWRSAATHYGITAFIGLDGIVPSPSPFQHERAWAISDSNILPDLDTAMKIAGVGARWVRRGEKLLVTCLGGQNRSGWMCGLVLWKLRVGDGKKIYDMIKDGNPDALWRRGFREHILSLPRR